MLLWYFNRKLLKYPIGTERCCHYGNYNVFMYSVMCTSFAEKGYLKRIGALNDAFTENKTRV